MNYLIRFQDNYADEFDVTGFAVVDQELWSCLQAEAKEHFSKYSQFDYYFGGNDCLEYKSYSEWESAFKIVETIDDEKSRWLIKAFGMWVPYNEKYIHVYGIFPFQVGL